MRSKDAPNAKAWGCICQCKLCIASAVAAASARGRMIRQKWLHKVLALLPLYRLAHLTKVHWALICILPLSDVLIRPTYTMMDLYCLIDTWKETVWLIFQYKYTKPCAEDQMLQHLILRTRLCGTGFISQLNWLFHFRPTKIIMVEWNFFVPVRYQLPKAHRWGWSGVLRSGQLSVESTNQKCVWLFVS